MATTKKIKRDRKDAILIDLSREERAALERVAQREAMDGDYPNMARTVRRLILRADREAQ